MPATAICATFIGAVVIAVAQNEQNTAPKLSRLPPLDFSKLEELYRENWQDRNFSDETNGVFVEVVERQYRANELINPSWRTTFDTITEGNTQWISSVGTSPQRIVKLRIRKDTKTLSFLINSQDAPLYPRYIALRTIYEVQFSQNERLELIEISSRDPKSEIRDMAFIMASEFQREASVVPICTRALTDPCIDVAYRACHLLIHFFNLRTDKTNDALNWHGGYEGPPEGLYKLKYDTVICVAERIHAIHPTLVTDEDIAVIRTRQIPSEAWWKTFIPGNNLVLRSDFIRKTEEHQKKDSKTKKEL